MIHIGVMRDFYATLGVSREASLDEIRSAFRRLARLYHPDVSQLPDAATRFAEITAAYRVLGNPVLRARYDQGESVLPSPPRPCESRRRRAARVRAYRIRIESIINDMLEAERREAEFRAEAILFVVVGWFSTVAAAAVQPSLLFGPDDLPTKLVLWGVCLFGLWFLGQRLWVLLEHYTYRQNFLSVTAPSVPVQPFSRSVIVGLLLVGYASALLMGYWLGRLINYRPNALFPVFDAVYNGLLFPPIVLLLLNALHRWERTLRRI
ncbi:MAG: J domain-containing protein [Acidobacteriota bacterium]